MLGTFLYAFNAVSPILLLVFMGYFLKSTGRFTAEFFKKINTFAFHYCFPCLMFTNLYGLSSIHEMDPHLTIYLLFSIVVLTILGFIITFLTTDVRTRKGVLIMSAFRSNFAIIGLPLSEGIAGSAGMTLASTVQAPTIIYFNIVSVFVLSIFSEHTEVDIKKILLNILKNPIIQGLIAGTLALIIREYIPVNGEGELVFSVSGSLPWLYTTINYLSRSATPICLIALGGQFSFSAVSSLKKEITVGVFMRLILAPLLGFAMAFTAVRIGFITMTPTVCGILIAAYGSPIAVSSNIMAQEMGADDTLSGQIVVWSSLLSMITVFFMIVLFRTIGIL